MRLIDADAYDKILEHREKILMEYIGSISGAICGCRGLLSDQPTVDAVEVVRCKDCKHWMKDIAGCTNFVGRCEFTNYMVGATGYCVYGERKDNEGRV